MFSLNTSRGNGGVHGHLAILSLRPDISRVDRPVFHARTVNDAIFSMINGAVELSGVVSSFDCSFDSVVLVCS